MLPVALVAAASCSTAVAVITLQRSVTVTPFTIADRSTSDASPVGGEAEFADDGWSVVTVNSLRDVEDLLDSLEAHQVSEREVRVVGDSSFRVRWK